MTRAGWRPGTASSTPAATQERTVGTERPSTLARFRHLGAVAPRRETVPELEEAATTVGVFFGRREAVELHEIGHEIDGGHADHRT